MTWRKRMTAHPVMSRSTTIDRVKRPNVLTARRSVAGVMRIDGFCSRRASITAPSRKIGAELPDSVGTDTVTHMDDPPILVPFSPYILDREMTASALGIRRP